MHWNRNSAIVILFVLICLTTCKPEKGSPISRNDFDLLKAYAYNTFELDLSKGDHTLLIIKVSDCDCVETSFDIAVKAMHFGAKTFAISRFEKDLIKYEHYIKKLSHTNLFIDSSSSAESDGLLFLPITCILHVVKDEVRFFSKIDRSTEDNILRYFDWE